MNSSQIGDLGEQIAESYLREQGFYIVARNYKAGEGRSCVGEIDIAAIKNDVLHIVEVKTRHSCATAGDYAPESAFTPQKIKRLQNAARQFAFENSFDGQVSFDLISLNLKDDGSVRSIRCYVDIVH